MLVILPTIQPVDNPYQGLPASSMARNGKPRTGGGPSPRRCLGRASICSSLPQGDSIATERRLCRFRSATAARNRRFHEIT
jgi:hypothetical protein